MRPLWTLGIFPWTPIDMQKLPMGPLWTLWTFPWASLLDPPLRLYLSSQ
jgi:hypothetical protein